MKPCDSNHSAKYRILRYRPILAVLAAGACCASGTLAQYSKTAEYALIGYQSEAHSNPVARLSDDLHKGRQSLEYAGRRGYFDSLLDALDIDPDSQMLVFSPTSLQHAFISPATPRGLYFNDNTYLGFVQNSSLVEVATIDEELGLVFYTFDNTRGSTEYFERVDQACLVCHDTQGTLGGGVPSLMALSSVYSEHNIPLKNFSGAGNVVDSTPIEDRWGGWYVTGRHGLQAHLGNLMLESADDIERLDDYRIWNLDTFAGAGYFDTSAYVRDTSDIVALMVLEHQITVQNQIIYVRFKTPALLHRRGLEVNPAAQRWSELSSPVQAALARLLDPLIEALVFTDAAEFASRITGSSAFTEDFQARGPMDDAGRSLRQLDLETRLFRYPLSYLIYTNDFASLPAYAKDYVYRQLSAYLGGADHSAGNRQYALADRRAALEILTATEPAFADY